MKDKLRTMLMIGLVLVFLVSGGQVVYRAWDYKKSAESYAEALQLVGLPPIEQSEPPERIRPVAQPAAPPAQVQTAEAHSPEVPPSVPELPEEPAPAPEQAAEETPVWVDPYAEALKNMDFTALRGENDHVTGWITIPDTNVSYPLLQGEDNDYYLNHNWRKEKSALGAIYLDYRCSADLSDFHTIIYGHKMNSGAMFGQLYKYADKAYWEAHPNIYIADDNGSHTYQIFAIYEASATTGSTYRVTFENDGWKQTFLDGCVEQTQVETGIVPTTQDRILTLSTCTGNGHATRWVVQAVYRTTAENSDS